MHMQQYHAKHLISLEIEGQHLKCIITTIIHLKISNFIKIYV